MISFEMPQRKWTSSRLEGESPGFTRVTAGPSQGTMGTSGTHRVSSGEASLHTSCEGLLGIPLQSVPGPRSSSGTEATTSGFL